MDYSDDSAAHTINLLTGTGSGAMQKEIPIAPLKVRLVDLAVIL